MIKQKRGAFIIVVLSLACSRKEMPTSVSIQLSLPTQKLSAQALGLGPTGWGARAVASSAELKCVGVLVGGPATDDLQKNQCVDSNETFKFGVMGGFVPLGQPLSVEVTVGSAREFRVYATSTEPGKPCPSFAHFDPYQVSQLREIGRKTIDVKAGESNEISISPNFSGALVNQCSGPAIATPVRTLDQCLFAASRIAANPAQFVSDHAIVALKRGASATTYITSIAGNGLSAALVGSWNKIDSHLVSFSSSGSLANDLAKLCDGTDVSFVEPVEGSSPSDVPTAFYPSSSAPTAQPSPPHVAILDTGVEDGHSVIATATSVLTGWNYIGNNGDTADDEGNGTGIAGMVLEGAGVNLLSPSPGPIRLKPFKVLDSSGTGKLADVVTAILKATDEGASVITYPGGLTYPSVMVQRGIAYAMANDVLVVSAAGNSAADTDIAANAMYPGAWMGPLSLNVAATNGSGARTTFTNYGAKTVHLGSMGLSVQTLAMGSALAFRSGSTFAAARVAGTAAAAKAAQPALSMFQIRQLILQNVDPVAALSGVTVTGGTLSMAATVTAATAAPVETAEPLIFFPQ